MIAPSKVQLASLYFADLWAPEDNPERRAKFKEQLDAIIAAARAEAFAESEAIANECYEEWRTCDSPAALAAKSIADRIAAARKGAGA